jgi:hypothetical protein
MRGSPELGRVEVSAVAEFFRSTSMNPRCASAGGPIHRQARPRVSLTICRIAGARRSGLASNSSFEPARSAPGPDCSGTLRLAAAAFRRPNRACSTRSGSRSSSRVCCARRSAAGSCRPAGPSNRPRAALAGRRQRARCPRRCGRQRPILGGGAAGAQSSSGLSSLASGQLGGLRRRARAVSREQPSSRDRDKDEQRAWHTRILTRPAHRRASLARSILREQRPATPPPVGW